MLGDIGDYLGATFGEVGKHPWQAAGAALGVPGFDPAIGGIFNNRPGGALLSPTGNFTSSAWGDMYKDNPNNTAGLDLFHRTNSIADVIAPMIAGGYASGGLGGGGGGFGGLMGGGSSSGAGTTLGPDMAGSGGLFGVGSGMGMGAMPGTTAPELASASPYAGAFGGSSMAYPFSITPTSSMSIPQMMAQASSLMQQRNQQQQQGAAPVAPHAVAYGNPAVRNPSIGQPTPYAQFSGAGAQPFGFGGMYV